MAGCRGLTDIEIKLVITHLKTPRDIALFVLGTRTGFRISELLSLKVSDIYQQSKIVDRIRISKRNMKGKTKTREVALHPQAKQALMDLINSGTTNPEAPLFISRNGELKPLSRHGAHKLLKMAFTASGLTGHLATHTMRKSFAKRVYTNLQHDLLATKEALGHSDIGNTIKYLEVNQTAIDKAVLSA